MPDQEVLDLPATRGTVEYDASNAIAFTARAQRALNSAKEYTIDSQDLCEFAADDLRAVKALRGSVDDKRTAIVRPLNTAVKAVNDLFRAPLDYLDDAERIIKGKMVAWVDKQEKIAREAREKAAAEARAEQEKLLAQQREQEQKAREASELAAKAQRDAEAAHARGDAEAASAAQAEADKQAAVSETAAAEAQAAEITSAVVTAPPAAVPARKPAGISTSKQIDYELVDLVALIKHVAAHPEHQSLLMVDSVRLRAYVKGMGHNTDLPGVRVFDKTVMASRGR